MTPEITQELLKILIIFIILVMAVLFMVEVITSVRDIRYSLKYYLRWWKRFIRETDWLGILIILGIALIFACHGHIIIY